MFCEKMPPPPAFESSFYYYCFLDAAEPVAEADGFEVAGVLEVVELDGFIWPSLKINFFKRFLIYGLESLRCRKYSGCRFSKY